MRCMVFIDIFGQAKQEFMEFQNCKNMQDVKAALRTGWITPRRLTIKVSSVTNEPMTNADGEAIFVADQGEPTILNAQIIRMLVPLDAKKVRITKLTDAQGKPIVLEAQDAPVVEAETPANG